VTCSDPQNVGLSSITAVYLPRLSKLRIWGLGVQVPLGAPLSLFSVTSLPTRVRTEYTVHGAYYCMTWSSEAEISIRFPLPFLAHPPYDTASRMLKKSACFVLASLRGSTRRELLGGRKHWRDLSVHQDPFKGRTAHTKCGTYLLASSLAAAAPDGLFEHPAGHSDAITMNDIAAAYFAKMFGDCSRSRKVHAGQVPMY